MKDYSKVKYVKPSVDGLDITKGKVYRILKKEDGYRHIYNILDDVDYEISISIKSCCHLDGGNWIPCDEKGKEIEL